MGPLQSTWIAEWIISMLDTDPRASAGVLTQFARQFLVGMGCSDAMADEVAEHLIDADLCGVYSHGVFRLVQYATDARAGEFEPGWRAGACVGRTRWADDRRK